LRCHWRAISSGAAQAGLPGQVAYSASKAALLGMVKTIAAENVGRGITANAVLPGFVETENVLSMPAEVLDRVRAALPAGRMAAPREVAVLVAANAAATLVRFVLLRSWVFRPGRDAAPSPALTDERSHA